MRRRNKVLLMIFVACCAAGAACLDLAPSVLVAPPRDAAPPPDTSPPPMVDGGDASVPDVDPRPPCQQCVEAPDVPGPGCATEVANCHADPQCGQVYDCAVANGCLVNPTRKTIVTCGLPCVIDAGIKTQGEPSALLLEAFLSCGLGTCAAFCALDASPD